MKKNTDIVSKADSMYQQAVELLNSHKIPEAEILLKKIIKVLNQKNYPDKYCQCLNKLGLAYINHGKYPEAGKLLKKGLLVAKKNNLLKITANITESMGLTKYYRGFHHEAMDLYREALRINKILNDKIEEKNLTGKIANTYFELNDYKKAIHYFKIQEKLCIKYNDGAIQSYAYGGLAMCYLYMYDFEKTFYYLDKQILLCKKLDARRSLSIALCNTGYSYFKKQDFDHALSYLYQALNNDKKLNNLMGLIYIYSSLGNVYKGKKDYKNSLKYFKKQLALSKQLKIHMQEASALGDIGIIHNVKGEYKSALKHFKKQINICRKNNLPLALFFALNNLGEVYRLTNKNNLSLKCFNELLILSKKVFGTRHPNTARAYRNLGNAFLSANNFTKALSFYQKSLVADSKKFKSNSLKNNPSIEEAFSEEELYETLNAKAYALRKLHEKEKNSLFNLELSLSVYELALSLTGKIRSAFREENSKYFMSGNLLSVYEEAIGTAVEIYNNNGNKKFLDKAFYLSERNKAATLLESMKDSEAKLTAKLPAKLVEKEKHLKSNIAFKESEKHKELQKGRKSDKKIINKFDEKIFELKREYNAFIDSLEKNYPEYYNHKKEITNVSIKNIREKLLTDRKIIIEYFAGEKNIYIFKITARDIAVIKMPMKKSFEKNIKDLRNSLVTLSLLNFSANFKKFSDNAYKLYLILLGSVLDQGEDISGIIIIPDNVIGYIPFEALITQPPAESSTYKNISYLIKKFTVSYGYSSVYLLKNTSKQNKLNQKNIIGFAPEFNNALDNSTLPANAEETFRSQLVPLNYNETELNEIGKYFPGDYYVKQNATKKAFLDAAGEYSIIHLATHCVMDEINPMFSRICFSQSENSPDESYLQNFELYNLRLNSRLAVLSACHTGAGKMIKGEGILSVARGFAYSNCSSIVMSLWQVNDLSTSKLMVDFYKELFHGNNIDDSLKLAKLHYLENANDYNASPFFWASFILIGNSGPIKLLRLK